MIPARLLPGDLRYCVAGGWAACPALATDVDVWVYGVEHEEFDGECGRITRHLSKTYYDDFDPLTEQTKLVTYDHVIPVRKIGRVYDDVAQATYDIMVCEANTPYQLLDGFDISTHMVAIDYTGRVIKHDLWTPSKQMPLINRMTSKTGDRMRKICKRFGLDVPHILAEMERSFVQIL